MKLTFAAIFLIISSQNFYTQDLPHWMTSEESILWQKYNYPVNPLFSDPPPSPTWNGRMGRTSGNYNYMGFIPEYLASDCRLCTGRRFCIHNLQRFKLSKNIFAGWRIPLHNIKYLITSYNSIWVRDYGPWTAYTNDIDTLNIIDWIYNRPRPLDDVTPVFFANYINSPIYQTTTSPYNLTHAGGNLMIDGHGTAFSSKLILK